MLGTPRRCGLHVDGYRVRPFVMLDAIVSLLGKGGFCQNLEVCLHSVILSTSPLEIEWSLLAEARFRLVVPP